jgi:HSP20 family protein
MLMRFDPFRDLDRLFDTAGTVAGPRPLPMNAVRRGEHLHVTFDIPGVSADDIDLSVERNQLTLNVERRVDQEESDEWLVRERPTGRYSRQVLLGDNLDADKLEASYADGVLELTIPVAEAAKPRKINVGNGGRAEAIDAESSTS